MSSKLKMIVAKSKNNAIGKDNKLLWYIPEDLQHFKSITQGNIVVMGRETYDSIGRPLPNRRNIVVSRDKNLKIPNVEVVNDIEYIYDLLDKTTKDIFIIGGQTLYEYFIDDVDVIYVTEVNIEIEGDTYFPNIDDTFELVSSKKGRYKYLNKYKYFFNIYKK